MTLPLGSDTEFLGLGTAGGVCLGNSSSDKVGFFGATPVVKPTSASQAAVTGTVTTTATTTALAVDVAASIVLLNQLRGELVDLGLLVGS